MKFERPEEELLIRCLQPEFTEQAGARIVTLLGTNIDWEYLVKKGISHRVAPWFWHQISRFNDASIPAEIAERLKAYSLQSVIRSFSYTQELLRISEAFKKSGVSFIPFKGPVLALLIYGDVALRDYDDLDVLVHKSDVTTATNVLDELGYKLSHDETDQTDRYLEEVKHHFQFADTSAHVVELHWSLGQSQYAFSESTDTFWEGLTMKPFFGGMLNYPRAENLLLFLCAHGHKHFWSRLSWLCDVAQMCRLCADELDWAYLFQQAHLVRTYRATLLGLFLANDMLDAPVPAEVLAAVRDDENLQSVAAEIQKQLFSESTRTTQQGQEIFVSYQYV